MNKLINFISRVDWFKGFLSVMALSGFLIIAFVYGYYNYNFPFITDDNELWAQFGDFVGGTLSSIFSFLTFLAILYTLHLQREELGLNREELRLSREELKIANKEAGDQTRISRTQLENSKRQKNEAYLLEYMQVYSKLERDVNNPRYSHKIGSSIIDSFLSGKYGIQNDQIINKDGYALDVVAILKYLNCLEYLIHWDLLQVQDETFNTQPIPDHRSFSSKYAPFIKSFCDDKTFIHLSKSGVLLKMNIAAQFPNIVRFI
ncbi:hypothetical protein EHQ43_10100 [Leptospira bouyouniensis]|uniref:Phage abortive infection protein n=1 Tax=Leptospira bouyouniensis TaxID=2484911 RepID=A0A7I0HRW7_9LEPT|nr:hypothetical protein [Leptospira bouyouniensis]TGL04987.1 hypothetical protein EHQ43_10100 [Leptospira bouyouniensis]